MQQDAIAPAVPFVREVSWTDPATVAGKLHGNAQFLFLDSAMSHERLGRYSYVLCEPVDSIAADDSDGWFGARLPRFPMRHLDELPPFQGGFAGYVGYEAGRLLEPTLRGRTPAGDIRPAVLNVYDVVAAFDRLARRAWIISTGYPEVDPARRLDRAQRRLEEWAGRLERASPFADGPAGIREWSSNFTRANFETAVARTVEYILAGDIFQANIAQKFTAAIPSGFDAFSFYRSLRTRNPATFAAYLRFGDLIVCSSSPERLVSFDGTAAEARPIKGTRRRDADPNADAALKQELLASRKDRAENVMIVDLLRNDLSRVCDPGTVDVPVLCGLESYASVHHLVSSVTGRLAPGRDAGDLLAAVFPGGSITGAPKLRAMEVIGEIERCPRDIYCGSIGFIGFSGRMDFNIAIRTAMFHNGVASFQAGGGITAKSDPAAEYDETLDKARRLFEAFGAEPPR